MLNTIELSDFTPLLISKAKEAPAIYRQNSTAAALYWAALELWLAEYHSWQAVCHTLGYDSSPARCAWTRRTAYSEAAALLLHAW